MAALAMRRRKAALFASWNFSGEAGRLRQLEGQGAERDAKVARTLQALSPDRKVMLFNSQVGCCDNPSGACSAKYKHAFPQWFYMYVRYCTSTTMFQPSDGGDDWNTIILRHASAQGRTHLARPGSWLDPGFLTLDVGANYYNGSGMQLKLDQNRAIFSLWAIVSVPLVASVSFSGRICPASSFGQPNYGERCIPSRPVPQVILEIMKNQDAIAINQEFDSEHWHVVGDLIVTCARGRTPTTGDAALGQAFAGRSNRLRAVQRWRNHHIELRLRAHRAADLRAWHSGLSDRRVPCARHLV